MSIVYDWYKATVRLRVPVKFTATSDVAEIDIPLGALAALLAQYMQTDLPLAVLDESDVQQARNAATKARADYEARKGEKT